MDKLKLKLILTEEDIKYKIVHCIKCRRKRSAKNAIQNDGEIGGQQQRRASFFAHIDSLGKNQTKLPIKIALMIMFLWAKDISLTKIRRLLGNLIGNCNEVSVDWRNYYREACLNAFREPNLPKMGRTNQIVQIDESLMRKKVQQWKNASRK